MKTLLTIISLAFVISSIFGGTLMLKDGTNISKVTILNIQKGRMTIEKDGAKMFIPLGKIDSYFHSNVDTSDLQRISDDLSDYKISVQDIVMPEHGEDKQGKETSFTLSYRLSSIGEEKKLLFPYFYLYVLASGGSDVPGQRKIFRYYFPKKAKPKGKNYDQAAIKAVITKMDRPIIHRDQLREPKINTKSLSGRQLEIPLNKIKKSKILAYHLEIWGMSDIIFEKDWKGIDVKVGKRWWERY